MKKYTPNARRICTALTLLALIAPMQSACTPTVTQRGNMVEDYQLENVVPTLHTRADVLRIMGSPTTIAPFDDNTWYYIGQETEKRGILDPEVAKERIIVVKFDAEGILESVQERKDGRIDIPVARKKTPTYGTETSVTQDLFGNLGKFNSKTNQ